MPPTVLPVTTRDGRTLHAEIAGEGRPTVVLEAGMGASRHMWGGVAPALADRTTTLVYDRSGLGRSPADPATRDLDRLAADLLDVLDHVEGPVVLVGHSWGGPIVRAAAAERPERVAGIVLVDPSDEGCAAQISDANLKRARSASWMLPLMSRTGLVRLQVRALAKKLPAPSAAAFRAEDGTHAAVLTQVAEAVGSLADLRRLAADPLPVPDVPLTVISGAVAGRMEGGHRPELIAAHRARAEAAPRGRHVMAGRSGHMVPFTEPEVVVAEVLRLLDPPAPSPPPPEL